MKTKARILTLLIFSAAFITAGLDRVSGCPTQHPKKDSPAVNIPEGSTAQSPLKPGGKVVLRLSQADVTVTGSDGDQVSVTADTNTVTLRTDPDRENTVLIESAKKEERGPSVIKIVVPKFAEVEIVIRGGDVSVKTLDGGVTIESGGGDVSVSEVGRLKLQTGGGDVKVEKINGETMIASGGGDFDVSEVAGPVKLVAGGGDVTIVGVQSANVQVGGGDISMKNVGGDAEIQTGSGDVSVTGVQGNCGVRTVSGDVHLEAVEGSADIALAEGDVSASRIKGDLTVKSIGSDVSVKDVQGRVEINIAKGDIVLKNVGGGVEAMTTSGDITLHGPISRDGKYKLKTTSGDLKVTLPEDTAGFSATLTSYTGQVSTDFQLTATSSSNRRIVGRFGDGGAQIYLDAFSGSVTLVKQGGRK